MARECAFLPDVLKGAGLPVEVAPDFLTWARPYTMDLWGLIWHHTASGINSSRQTNINVVHNGNSTAPGPIAQVLSCREQPRLYLVSAGYCNHAGKGYWPRGTDTGNKTGIGIEWVNNGVGEPAHPESVEVTARAIAAIFEHMGWDLSRLWTHHAYAPTRKIDPAAPADFTGNVYRTWSLADVRGQVAQYQSQGGDSMGIYVPLDDEVRQLDTRWWGPDNFLNAGQAYPIGRHDVIPANAIALKLNVTITEPKANGFAKVWSQGRAEPPTSKINFAQGWTIANEITVRCQNGAYMIKSIVPAHMVIDCVGYYV